MEKNGFTAIASNRLQGVRKAVNNNGLGTPVQTGVRFWKNLSANGANGVTYGTTWKKVKGAYGYQIQIWGREFEVLILIPNSQDKLNSVKASPA